MRAGFSTLFLMCGVTATAAAEWTPPLDPKPSAILQEAHLDTTTGRLDDALAKHLWYHRNALKIEPAQAGVRLSFALMYWKELADKHPPAKKAMDDERADAKTRVINDREARSAFQEFVAFNRTFSDDAATISLFSELEKKNAPRAKELYPQAEPALIRAKDYQTCGKYADPESFTQYCEVLHLALEPAADKRFADFARKQFRNRTCTLVALLIVNKHEYEAKTIATEARKELSDPGFHADLDDALKGNVPNPWP